MRGIIVPNTADGTNTKTTIDTKNKQSVDTVNIHAALLELCHQHKRRYLIASAARLSVLIALLVLLLHSINMSKEVISVLACCAVFCVFIYATNTRRYKEITPLNLLLHLNRLHPEFEESAQLLNHYAPKGALQSLQRQKVAKLFSQKYQQNVLTRPMPRRAYMPWLTMAVILAVITFQLDTIKTQLTQSSPSLITPLEAEVHNTIAPTVIATKITITPPSYTKLPVKEQSTLDIEALEQSHISWQLTVSNQDLRYFLIISNQPPIEFMKTSDGHFVLQEAVYNTNLYRIAYSEQLIPLEQVYSLSIYKDEKPNITIVSPKSTITQIAKNAPPILLSQVIINDDFGINKVEILASVAKGSGESVKFRDETFTFDHNSAIDSGTLYEKTWDLEALGMEPGDEVYFTVYAWDNRTPKQQQSRSATSIVRWLDDEIAVVSADGILINFEAEYFRSQRQIIIDTEQLLLDKTDLTSEQFNDISQELGQSQSDLKQRYGQYLGDEFGEGEGAELLDNANVDIDPEHENEAQDKLQEEAKKASNQIPDHGHEEHDHDNNNDKSGMNQILARFGHNHGEADLGPITKRNPKALMKRAVSIMWQAELHLMLSEPEKALPFEKEAYKYLKLAKQAERIYVKRLGFEPPPVKEDKRLTGELNDILSNNISHTVTLDYADDARLFKQLFTLFNEQQFIQSLTPKHRQTLDQGKQRFTQLAQENPALIKHAALLEKILVVNSIRAVQESKHCDHCIEKFKIKLWQLLPNSSALPIPQSSSVNKNQIIYQQYLQRIQVQQNRNVPSNKGAN